MKDALADAMPAEGERDAYIVTCAANRISIALERICEENGLPKVSTHCLRHSWATYLLIERKIPHEVVMRWGGWKNTYTMESVYTHANEMNSKRYHAELINFDDADDND